MTKKLLSALLALLFVCSLLPFAAFADVVYSKLDGKIFVPGILEDAIDAKVTPSENGVELKVTLKDAIAGKHWAYLYYGEDGKYKSSQSLVLDCELDIPEGAFSHIEYATNDPGTFADAFADFQESAVSYIGNDDYHIKYGENEETVGLRIPIAKHSLDAGNVTITPNDGETIEQFFAWLDGDDKVISYTVVKYIITRECDTNFYYSKSELEDMALSENRLLLEKRGFFKHWDEKEELLKSFEPEENPGDMEINISFGGSEQLPKGIECDFVDGILEIKVGKLELEDLVKAYDVFSAAQGNLYLGIRIKLPEGTAKFADGRGNGPYFEIAKDDIGKDINDGDFEECDPEEDNYAYFNYEIGRFVKDGDQVLFFPKSDSGLDFEFIGYCLENKANEVNYAGLVMNVYSTPEARIVSFKDPIAPTPVDAAQIVVDGEYEDILSGEKDGNPNYDSETGTLTYVYQGEGTTEEEIIGDFNSNGITGNSKTSTIIKAPDGYTLFKLYDSMGEEMEFDPESVSVFCPFVREEHLYNRNMRYTFLWKKLADGSFLYQEIYVTNDFKNKLTYFDIYWEVPKEEQVKIRSEKQGFVSLEELAESGIIVNIDWESGYVHTSFLENPDLNKFGECVAFIMPPEEATHFKANNGGGNTEFPPSYDKDRADERERFFDSAAEFEKIEGDLEDPYDWLPNLPVLVYDSASVGDITYYYSSFISTEHLIIEWYNGGEKETAERIEPEDGKRGYFLYLKMDDLSFIKVTEGIEEEEINEDVKYPTVVKSGGSSKKWFLKTEIAPQDSESQAKLFDLKAQFETEPGELTRIFIPYSAIDFKGDIESNNFQFKITHYDGCENLAALEDYLKDNKGVQVACEYDEYGIYFYTDSFSPFVFEFEDLGLKNPEEPEKHRHSSDTVIIGARDTDEKKAEEENPYTGAFVPEKPVELLAAGMILSFAIMSLSKNK